MPSFAGNKVSISTNSFFHIFSAILAGMGGRFRLTTTAWSLELGGSDFDRSCVKGVFGDSNGTWFAIVVGPLLTDALGKVCEPCEISGSSPSSKLAGGIPAY